MNESQMMWLMFFIVPLSLWVAGPAYVEHLQQGPNWSQTTLGG